MKQAGTTQAGQTLQGKQGNSGKGKRISQEVFI